MASSENPWLIYCNISVCILRFAFCFRTAVSGSASVGSMKRLGLPNLLSAVDMDMPAEVVS